MCKVYIWGTGFQATKQMESDIYKECEIIGFIDSYKKDSTFFDYPVIEPCEIENIYYYFP